MTHDDDARQSWSCDMNATDHRQPEPSEADLATNPLDALRLGRPTPALRQRTVSAVRAALAATPAPVSRWHAWRIEAALAGAIAVCALLLLVVDGLPAELRPEPAASLLADGSGATLASLDSGTLEPYIRVRLALARRNPDSEPRYPTHDFTSRTFDAY